MRKMTLKEMQEMRDFSQNKKEIEKWQNYIDNYFLGGEVPVTEE